MKIITAKEMKTLINHPDYINGGIVFQEYGYNVENDLMITDGLFGATVVIPQDEEVYSFDWNINEYLGHELFIIYDDNDIMQMIQTLVKHKNIHINYE